MVRTHGNLTDLKCNVNDLANENVAVCQILCDKDELGCIM